MQGRGQVALHPNHSASMAGRLQLPCYSDMLTQMPSKTARQPILASLTGLLYPLCFPSFDLGAVAWFLLIPLHVALFDTAPRRGFWLGWLAGLIAFAPLGLSYVGRLRRPRNALFRQRPAGFDSNRSQDRVHDPFRCARLLREERRSINVMQERNFNAKAHLPRNTQRYRSSASYEWPLIVESNPPTINQPSFATANAPRSRGGL